MILKFNNYLVVQGVHIAFVYPAKHSTHTDDVIHVVEFDFARFFISTASQIVDDRMLGKDYSTRAFVEDSVLDVTVYDKEIAEDEHKGYDRIAKQMPKNRSFINLL